LRASFFSPDLWEARKTRELGYLKTLKANPTIVSYNSSALKNTKIIFCGFTVHTDNYAFEVNEQNFILLGPETGSVF
jgi:hypothetical protein